MTGKVWTSGQEAELRALVEQKNDIDLIASKLGKSPKAVITKCQRMGLALDCGGYVNTSVSIPKELPSVEMTARILAGALKASVKPGLSRVEVQRLQTVANISKAYKELIVDLAHYREVEAKLNLVVEQNAKLQQDLKELKGQKSQNDASGPVPG
jgi:hypothetical protein